MPICPPGRQTRSSSAAICSWSGANMAPAGGQDHVEGGVGEGEILGIALIEGRLQPFGMGALAGPVQCLGT